MIQEAKPSCRGQWYLPAGRLELNETLAQGELIIFEINETLAQGELIRLEINETLAQGELIRLEINETLAQGELIRLEINETLAQGELIRLAWPRVGYSVCVSENHVNRSAHWVQVHSRSFDFYPSKS